MTIDLVKIAESYGVKLKKVGRVYQGLCPFHDERTPSFTVYPDTNSFFCFGCQVGGDWRQFLKLVNPELCDQFSLDLSSLEHSLAKLEERDYKNYLLLTSAKIFNSLFKKHPVNVVMYIMKKFDTFIEKESVISLETVFRVLKKLERFL